MPLATWRLMSTAWVGKQFPSYFAGVFTAFLHSAYNGELMLYLLSRGLATTWFTAQLPAGPLPYRCAIYFRLITGVVINVLNWSQCCSCSQRSNGYNVTCLYCGMHNWQHVWRNLFLSVLQFNRSSRRKTEPRVWIGRTKTRLRPEINSWYGCLSCFSFLHSSWVS